MTNKNSPLKKDRSRTKTPADVSFEVQSAPKLRTERERLEALRAKLTRVPLLPGVYIHKDETGHILYVGKAKLLQNRLRSYFTGLDRQTPKTRALVSRIHDFEVIVVDNENESLLLENNLIKHHQPPYNILLRDDKHYPYLRMDMSEPWPRLVTTRKRKNDGAVYFGPYSSGSELYRILGVVNRFFKLIKCSPQVFRTVQRPCNYFDVKKCWGPCKLPFEKAEYSAEVNKVVQILRGRSGPLIKQLKEDMFAASELMNFEKAALLRDQAKALETLQDGQAVAFQPGFHADVISYFVEGDRVSFFVSILRDGKVVGGESHILNLSSFVQDQETLVAEGSQIADAIEVYLGQFYATREVPDFVCLPKGDPFKVLRSGSAVLEMCHYLKTLKKTRNEDSEAVVDLVLNSDFPLDKNQKGESRKILKESYRSLVDTGFENAKNRLLEKLSIDEKSQSDLLQLQTFLGLEKLPTWIECYDISTFQGSQNVASGVVFRNAKPSKSDYRKYIIKDVQGQDDFASLREVTRRRFHEEKRLEVPDVFLVDGGEPQVREVSYVLKSLGLDHVPLFGIAKSRTQSSYQSVTVKQSQERILFPRREAGLLCPDRPPKTEFLEIGSAEYRILTQIRNEAHRFAITFHRKKRDQKSKMSALNEIKGVGAKTRKALLSAFGSVAAMKEASAEEINEKAQIGPALARKVKKALSGTL